AADPTYRVSFRKQPSAVAELCGEYRDQIAIALPHDQAGPRQQVGRQRQRFHFNSIGADERQRRDRQLRQQAGELVGGEEIDAAAIEFDRVAKWRGYRARPVKRPKRRTASATSARQRGYVPGSARGGGCESQRGCRVRGSVRWVRIWMRPSGISPISTRAMVKAAVTGCPPASTARCISTSGRTRNPLSASRRWAAAAPATPKATICTPGWRARPASNSRASGGSEGLSRSSI